MKFIKGIPNIKIIANDKYLFDITTVQRFVETEDKVLLQCAEEVSEFKRGFMCDMDCTYEIIENETNNKSEKNDSVKNLILVHINKNLDYNYPSNFEYIFYK